MLFLTFCLTTLTTSAVTQFMSSNFFCVHDDPRSCLWCMTRRPHTIGFHFNRAVNGSNKVPCFNYPVSGSSAHRCQNTFLACPSNLFFNIFCVSIPHTNHFAPNLPDWKRETKVLHFTEERSFCSFDFLPRRSFPSPVFSMLFPCLPRTTQTACAQKHVAAHATNCRSPRNARARLRLSFLLEGCVSP